MTSRDDQIRSAASALADEDRENAAWKVRVDREISDEVDRQTGLRLDATEEDLAVGAYDDRLAELEVWRDT